MKILIIGGLGESLINFRGHLLTAMQAKGLDVHVAAPDLHETSHIFRQLKAMGLSVHCIPVMRNSTNPFADLRLAWTLLGLMYKIAPDMVLGYTVKPVIYGTLTAWIARVPRRFALITGLGYAFKDDRHHSFLRVLVHGLYYLSIGRASLTFFQNPDDLALFRKCGILSRNSPVCVVNGSGVDLDRFAVKPFPLNNLEAAGAQFLFVGRLLGDKGIYEYMQAVRLIKRAHPEVRCLLVGWIDSNPNSISRDELSEWLADSGVEFLGRLTDVRPAIETCSVFVLPSYREGTPRTVLEAMSMGRPIITTDTPGCRETVIDGDNGFLIPVKNINALVEAMKKFIDDPSLISRMGARSRQIVEDKYDVHKVNAVMLKAMGL
ncbi:MAG: glycosyltransferase family 1 protein [Polynucleobacter sp. 39-45-136]|jgi:glycosyltransferase involved in cell wall biosynthesis|nr:MAG: glycosyltransferase family 1 protein [Polynucleobacter sp. 39-45-136]